jgi:putative DNA primase/helicase
MLMLIGPRRSGKGTIARVLTRLLGIDNVCGPTLSGLATNFGLWPLLNKRLAIISDARLSGRTDQAVVTERLLSISGEDAITVDRKNLTPLTLRLPTRFMVCTNELPRLADSSGALASRFLILRMTQSFYGQEDIGLTDRLLRELPGILNWAIEGWRRLNDRGHFSQPATGQAVIDELQDLASPVGAFIRQWCVLDPRACIGVEDLYSAWCAWCREQGREQPGNAAVFGRDLRAAAAQVATRQVRVRGTDQRVRQFEGICLTDAASSALVTVPATSAGGTRGYPL